MTTYNGIELTEEQDETIDCIKSKKDTKIQAPAGSGKTFTLEAAANEMQTRKGFYIAFNKAIAESAKQKFNHNVDCRTGHSIAFGQQGYKYKDRLGKITGTLIAKQMYIGNTDMFNTPVSKGYLILDTVRKFCFSADNKIQEKHVPPIKGPYEPEHIPEIEKDIVTYAKELWTNMSDPKGKMPITHDTYVKVWALNNPIIKKDFILLDEAQDANPVMLDIITKQKHAQKVYVGDKFQQIYGWRGAINAMDKIATKHSTHITQSFRFGQAIADMANSILHSYMPRSIAPPLIKGLHDKEGAVSSTPMDNPNVVICRTNSGVISNVFKYLERGTKVYVQGGVNQMMLMLRGARDLQKGKKTFAPDLALFNTWEEVVECSQTESGMDLRSFVNLIQEYGIEELMRALKSTSPFSKSADITLTTAHKCVLGNTFVETQKGIEYIKDIDIKGNINTPNRNLQPYKNKFKKEKGLVYKVTTKSGYQIGVSPEHGMTVWTGNKHEKIVGEKLNEGDLLRIKIGDTLEHVGTIKLKPTKRGYYNVIEHRTPSVLNEEVAELLGILVADGTLNRGGFAVGKRQANFVYHVQNLCKNLFQKTWKVKQLTENFWKIEVGSTHIANWLNKNFNGLTPHTKQIPTKILQSPIKIQAAFLKGLFEDGSVSVGENGKIDRITLTQKNAQIIKETQYLLLRQGIISKITLSSTSNTQTCLYIFGKQCVTFQEKIGFISDSKKNVLKNYSYRTKDNYFIPITKEECSAIGRKIFRKYTNVQNYENARLRGKLGRWAAVRLLQKDNPFKEKLSERLKWHYTEIIKIEKEEDYTYCVTVPEGERFLQNGFDGWNSKGLEWENVQLHSDFPTPPEDKPLQQAEINLLYVAATRALTNLDISKCTACHPETLYEAKNSLIGNN